MATDRDTIVELKDVTKLFDTQPGVTDRLLGREPRPVQAVENVDMAIEQGEVVGIAGESGCGKTTLGKLLVKLHDPTHGEVVFDGRNIAGLTREEERQFRQRVQMIFQDPFESLNPRMTVLDTVAEPLRINDLPQEGAPTDHPVELTEAADRQLDVAVTVLEEAATFLGDEPVRLTVGSDESAGGVVRRLADGVVTVEAGAPGITVDVSVDESAVPTAVDVTVGCAAPTFEIRRQRVITVLEDVGLSPAEAYLNQFPRELSGGERQRVAIARALVVDPEFVVADEPVSMLDVSIRASVLNLMQRLREEYDLTYVFISHDLSLIRYMCDRTAIMYLGDIIEMGETDDVVDDPKHPYTKALFDAVPKIDPRRQRHRANVTGEVPSARDPPAGCKFHPRCESIIPPDDWTGSQGAFRRLFGFKRKIRQDDLSVEELELPEDAPRERLVDALLGRGLALDVPEEHRLEGEVPKQGVDLSRIDLPADAERTLRAAAEDVVDGDPEGAYERLHDAYRSICEYDRPGMRPAGDQSTACHLYGETATPTVAAPADDD